MTARAKIQLKPRIDLETTDRPSVAAGPPPADRMDRRGKKIIAGHFPKATWEHLRNLCAKHDKTAQEFLDEALTDLFAKYRAKR